MKYKIILCDPPWQYEDKALAGNRGAGCKYDLMSDEELQSLNVQEISDETCVLCMWATYPKIQEALDLIKAWGFEYKTKLFTWIKTNQNGTLFIGMGHYTRSNDEIILLGVKGKVTRIDAGIRSVELLPITKHSQKPNLFRNRIVQLFGDLPRIELFARSKIPGWVCLGNEVDGQDIRVSLEQISNGTYNPKLLKEEPMENYF